MKKLRTKYLELPDIQIAYTEAGQGPILIFLHGNSESKALFKKYHTKYFKDFHTYALDSRGHGQSKSNDEKYSIEQYSEDVIHFCKAKGIEKASVIGYSDGGNISLFLGSKAPDIFERIVAISPNTLASGTEEKSLKLFRDIDKIMLFFQKIGINTRKARMRFDLMLNDIGLPEEDLNRIRTNLRILYAENDMIKESHILDIHRSIPGATVRKIGGCTHMNILESREAIEDMQKYLA